MRIAVHVRSYLIFFAGMLLAPLVAAHAADRPVRPNIHFILTDDQRWDTMGPAGNPIIQTPNMDRLPRPRTAR